MSSPLPETVPVLPTAELHVHIEGTLEPELAFALAARNRTRLRHADLDELRRAYAFRDLQSFLDLYYELTAVLQRPEDFADLADAYFARAAAQGVRHAEVFFDPQAHTGRGVPLEVVMEGLGEAFARAPERHGVSARLIACFLRDQDPAEAEDLLPRLLPYRDLVIGSASTAPRSATRPSCSSGSSPGRPTRACTGSRTRGRRARRSTSGPPSTGWASSAWTTATAASRTRPWWPGSARSRCRSPSAPCRTWRCGASPGWRSNRCSACSTRVCSPP